MEEKKAVLRATQAIIHLDAFRRNVLAARKKVGAHPKICVPVKANAYGHGAVEMSRCALDAGAEYLGVATVSEGAELRAAGITAPMLLFSQPLLEELPDVVALDLTPFVSDRDFIEAAACAARAARVSSTASQRLTVHLKIDTGMGRIGCRPEEAAALAALVTRSESLSLGGVATHLSVADSPEPDDIAYTKTQLRRFREAVDTIKAAGINPGILHAANSGALVFHEDSYFDMIRPGIFLYGYSPSMDAYPGTPAAAVSSEPVMELRSVVTAVKKINKGEAVSYCRTWIAPEDTYIGIIPAGYADGLPRQLSNNYSVLIRGKILPLVGKICMDQCIVHLGAAPDVRRWDEVTFFGPGAITAANISEKLGTIYYEVLCRISARVPRLYRG
ncbi:MAG: alanine racemase [Treponema sp.]|nr:alanine racemase [Treponema sp.]